MNGSPVIGRIRGIPVKAHFTLLIVLPYLAFLMAARFDVMARAAGVDPTALRLPPLVWGLLLAVLLFACILAHELGHALVALASGGRVSSITLMLLGGVSELHGLPRTPRAEGLVAVVGPLVSLAIGGAALGLHALLSGPADARFALFYLGQVNVVVAIFNLLPAFPMDGGRVLRALLSLKLSREKATRWAAATGMVFSTLFVAAGLVGGNLLLALIGLFVWSGARAELSMVQQDQRIGGLRVRDVMSPARDVVETSESASDAAGRMAAAHATALPVVDGPLLVGIVAARHLEALAPQERERTPVGAVVERNVPRLAADEALSSALERMGEHHVEEAPVLDQGRLVGVLETGDLARTLRVRDLARHAPRPLAPPLRPPADTVAPRSAVVELEPRRPRA